MIGGIHASGKSKLSYRLSEDISNIEIISPGKLLNHNSKTKTVDNIEENQLILTNIIKSIRMSGKIIVIDGHYGVLDKNSHLRFVGSEIFKAINPDLLVLVESSPETILRRLKIRDGKTYEIGQINKWSEEERQYAFQASLYIDKPIYIIRGTNK